MTWAVVVFLITGFLVLAMTKPKILDLNFQKKPRTIQLLQPAEAELSTVVRVGISLIAGSFGWLLASVPAGLVVFLTVFAVSSRIQTPKSKKERLFLLSQVDSTLELLSMNVQAGAPLRSAVKTVAEIVQEPTAGFLRSINSQLELGRNETEIWSELGDDPIWGKAAKDIARSVDSGTGITKLLIIHAEELREERRAELERTVRAVGVWAVLPLMACFLPAFLLVGVLPIIASSLSGLLG